MCKFDPSAVLFTNELHVSIQIEKNFCEKAKLAFTKTFCVYRLASLITLPKKGR